MTPRERPQILTAAEVRAVLNGSKTQHRVPVKRLHAPLTRIPESAHIMNDGGVGFISPPEHDSAKALRLLNGRGYPCPFGKRGDRIYVKESHAWVDYLVGSELDDPVCVAFKADQTAYSFAGGKLVKLDTYAWPWDRIKWRSPALMPRWASRLTLAVESVRVQRVQDISEEDARAEGVCSARPQFLSAAEAEDTEDPRIVGYPEGSFARDNLRRKWSMKHGADSWSRNDWVFALTFKRVSP
jgi:hypothetical protein